RRSRPGIATILENCQKYIACLDISLCTIDMAMNCLADPRPFPCSSNTSVELKRSSGDRKTQEWAVARECHGPLLLLVRQTRPGGEGRPGARRRGTGTPLRAGETVTTSVSDGMEF